MLIKAEKEFFLIKARILIDEELPFLEDANPTDTILVGTAQTCVG